MPEPSRLLKLDQLHTTEIGSKVRFLACVHAYDNTTAELTLKDRYPATTKDAPQAIANISNILDAVDHELLSVGSWLNVVGYVRRTKRNVSSVEATMIWSAGAIKLDAYNAAVTGLQDTARPK